MPEIKILVQHQLPAEEAAGRIKNLLTELKTQFGDKISDLRESWNGNSCQFSLSVQGLAGSGTINVKAKEVEISLNLPFMAMMFKGKIEATIKERLKELLS